MLRLINVCKKFKVGKNYETVLDNINLDFKKSELVFILGKSGSGKSTLLNIIGGIINVDSGMVMIDDKDITKFNYDMLCNYRNNMIGNVFQDYHLIEDMSVYDNIKLGMTIHNDKNVNRIDDVLRRVNIYDKKRINVNKLSGGEKQRVAIARAIINDPEIILCDEPTGALDSANSINIMDILKEISLKKLVIVVSHDNELAYKYADRIININDGLVDYFPQEDDSKFREINKSKISVISIIKLAVKNLCLKKWRTLWTSFAISIGVICALLVLCLSRSFKEDINMLENDIVSVFPISVYNGDFSLENNEDVKSNDKIIIKKKKDYIHTNKIDSNYLNFVNNIDYINYINYKYDISMPVISDRYKILDNNYMKLVSDTNFIDDNYEMLYGRNIDSIYDVLLKVDSNNNVSDELINVFNIEDDLMYDELIGRKLKVILNDLYYVKNGNYYYINSDNYKLYNESDLELNIVGIVREKEIVDDNSYFYYSKDLMDYIINKNADSKITKEQLGRNDNILGINMNREDLLSYLGYNTVPCGLDIYVANLDDKQFVLDKLDWYNNSDNNKLIYVDMMMDAINIIKDVIDVITVILVIFSMISIIVSSMMVFILTSNRVIENVKEIGILGSLGARRKDITRLFNIENFLIGIISSVIGIIVIYFIRTPINYVMEVVLDSSGMFKIYNDLVIFILFFNIFIVVLSGVVPSKWASKKRIIDCIYNRC